MSGKQARSQFDLCGSSFAARSAPGGNFCARFPVLVNQPFLKEQEQFILTAENNRAQRAPRRLSQGRAEFIQFDCFAEWI
jgi:hypothetical protein